MIRLAVCFGLMLSAPVRAGWKSIHADPKSGQAAAVLVDAEHPQVWTRQLLPIKDGKIAGKTAAAQTRFLLGDLARRLGKPEESLQTLLRLHVYARSDAAAREVRQVLAERFKKHQPAVTFVVGALPHAEALVAIDAIAARPAQKEPRLSRDADLAILPSGARVYISGQAEKGSDLAEATRKTLESLKKTLDWLRIPAANIVHVKAFVTPISQASVVHEEVEKFYGKGKSPPLCLVEWKSSLPIEIELVAWAGKAREKATDVIEFLTPPGMTASPVYSRLTRVNYGPTLFVSGLYGDPRKGVKAEIEDLFGKLKGILGQADSDFLHLAKATYYVATEESSRELNALRPRFYDKNRPPAASKALVAGTGQTGTTLTLDMIAVPKLNR